MTDIVAFMTARLDEDEQLARAAAGPVPGDKWSALSWYDGDFDGDQTARVDVHGRAAGPISCVGALERAHGEHIARHDPARVLAEVAAKRAILAAYDSAASDWTEFHESSEEHARRWALKTALEYLALPYADHSDYDESWRP